MVSSEFNKLVNIYEKIGGPKNVFEEKGIANLLVHKNKILNVTEVEGVVLKGKSTVRGVNADLLVKKNAKIKNPVHLCFGILPKKGRQEIKINVTVENGGEVSVIAHCIFPNAVKVVHQMDARIRIGENAKFKYQETHYHGNSGGIRVIPRAKVSVGKNSVYENAFTLLEGRVGFLDFNYEVDCDKKSIADMILKVYGKGTDEIKVVEKVNLNGESARSLIKTRAVLIDRAKAEVIGETYGNAPFARGHVDCIEILNGRKAVGKAIPIVCVRDGRAKVTHEAAIGSVDKKQLETLMARGLNQQEAIDAIVKGILR